MTDKRRKLTPDQIAEIQQLYSIGIPVKHIALIYGVSPGAASHHARFIARVPLKDVPSLLGDFIAPSFRDVVVEYKGQEAIV